MKYLYFFLALAAVGVIVTGCLGQAGQTTPTDGQSSQLFDGATDICQSAGGAQISAIEAVDIANQTAACTQVGAIKSDCNCNQGTGTCWLDIEGEHQGCAPACVINVDTREAEVNWRCTGAVSQ
ncbi:MAG TPA: hypothetical protein PK619_03720 [bacterium]|nr:hypothetical protein [bacterium]